MMDDMFSLDNITFDSNATTKDEALKFIGTFAHEQNIVKSEKAFYKGLKKREKEVTTGFKDGIAIPHCKNKTVIKPSIMVIKFNHPIEWESMDDKSVSLAFSLAIPEGENQQHLKVLSNISRALIDDVFTRAILKTTDKEEMYKLIKDKLMTEDN
ncbi:PTS sugar transporter subunit IIA [Paraliobacillus sp. JSM ZJ581]|uniref:PTS sugar transporter subunit IIA n=1 Tax=Paraliobacillus sp. JSM ZJ581 TaxID=3342118 RepID=UPI0035A89623